MRTRNTENKKNFRTEGVGIKVFLNDSRATMNRVRLINEKCGRWIRMRLDNIFFFQDTRDPRAFQFNNGTCNVMLYGNQMSIKKEKVMIIVVLGNWLRSRPRRQMHSIVNKSPFSNYGHVINCFYNPCIFFSSLYTKKIRNLRNVFFPVVLW